MRWTHLFAVAALTLVTSCGQRHADAKAPVASGTAPLAMAAADAAGICSEHHILEAVCTKCNPKLVPVFQAKGDWCAAHGFPESFCPICHPDRGGKPSADVTDDGAPTNGTKIRFKTKETARRAGIETVAAVERPNQTGVVAVVRIAYDGTRVAHVNARASGVVRAMYVDVGTKVRRGRPLVEIESASVGADQSKLLAAHARREVADANYRRTKDLLEKGIVPAKDAMLSQQELEAAKAEEEGTLKALRIVGTTGGDGAYTLLAPLDGIITQRNSSIGTLVDVEETLFEIVDPSSMWAEIDLPEAELSAVQVGQAVVVSVDGLGEREFTGKIDYIAPAIDPKTRTALARARLKNPDGVLRANMYGRAMIAVGETRTSVAIPRSALQRAKGISLVFVQLASDVYETRRVQVSPGSGDLIELAQGIRPGELVVTEGSFLLKTETLKESIGAGCCDVETKK